MKIVTERLILRPLKRDDLDDFYDYGRSAKVGPRAGWPPHRSIQESYSILEQMMTHSYLWAIELVEEHRLIGCIELSKDELRQIGENKALSLGYALNEKYWNRGYMTEAAKAIIAYGFEVANLELISVRHFDFNMESQNVIGKLGFKKEGIIRKAALNYDGKVHDFHIYSMTREEYELRYRERIYYV